MEKNIVTKNKKVHLALLICLVGFPQISETIYSPSLTEIARSYHISLNLAQMTLSIYFLAFALGVFFWGISSDYLGRRKAMNFGILFYVLGSLFCFYSTSALSLFIGRFIQAFGASTGSVTTQTILRDCYQGNDRHRLFGKISAALSFSPAIGPLVGGFIGEYSGFRAMFLFLVLMGLILLFWSVSSLRETKPNKVLSFSASTILGVGKAMLVDRYTLSFGLQIGIFNGILFSYHSEAPTIFIQKFHFSQSSYGFMGCIVALATLLGAWISSKALKTKSANLIIKDGIKLAFSGALLLCVIVLLAVPLSIQILIYIVGTFILLAGIGMALPNCLSLELTKFSKVVGTAGALLSLGYYIIVSSCTFLISIFHTGSIAVFPLFSVFLLVLSFLCIRLENEH